MQSKGDNTKQDCILNEYKFFKHMANKNKLFSGILSPGKEKNIYTRNDKCKSSVKEGYS